MVKKMVGEFAMDGWEAENAVGPGVLDTVWTCRPQAGVQPCLQVLTAVV